jgi:phosphatidylglycerol---prolipoprotein diacylglyceryl transferase
MYPVLFRIGAFEVTSFGVMMAVAALVGLALFRSELRRSGLPSDAADAGIVGVIGGFVGAKLLWTLEHAGDGALTERLFSRGGLSWYGGLIGGVGAGLVYIVVRGWPIVETLAAATPALAFGHLIGRIGCFLVGDDYGRPTDLPWGVAFPEGLPPTTRPVHPTQLYEAIGLGVLGWVLLRWRRRGVPGAIVLGRYLIGAGTLRFVIEFIRVNERVVGILSIAHLASLAAVSAGAGLLLWHRPFAKSKAPPGPARPDVGPTR